MKSGLFTFWFRFSLFNLFIVALFGVVMRYKIGFEFPIFTQKYLQHGHSHFAFTGWITHTLFTLLAGFVQRQSEQISMRKYSAMIIANMTIAWGMLISFSTQGYAFWSILFSIASIVIAWIYTGVFITDVRKRLPANPANKWFVAGLLFNVISAFGAFSLAYMMATKSFHPDNYLMSMYYFLHFQYNGWFFFACLGLLFYRLNGLPGATLNDNKIFILYFISCIPTYFLSVLWVKMPTWVYILVIVGALMQAAAWVMIAGIIKINYHLIKQKITGLARFLMLYVAIALTIKYLLQLTSTIPFISDLAFGFRPIVVAYLHLVLLAIISVFLLGYLYSSGYLKNGGLMNTSVILFITGVFLNEAGLTIQGLASIAYIPIPHINQILFGFTLIILFGAMLMFIAQLTPAGDKAAGKHQVHV